MPLDQEVLESQDFKDAIAQATTEATSTLQTSISKLESNNSNLLSEKNEALSQFNTFKSQFDGIDVESIKTMQSRLAEVDNDETRALLAEGKFDEVYAKKFETTQAEHKAQLDKRDKELNDSANLNQTLQDSLVRKVRGDGIKQSFIDTDADKSQLMGVQAISEQQVLIKDGKGGQEFVPVVFVDSNAESEFRDPSSGEILQNDKGTFGYQDFLKYLAEKYNIPLYAKPNGHGNNNQSNGNSAGKSFKDMSEKERIELHRSDPALYQKLKEA